MSEIFKEKLNRFLLDAMPCLADRQRLEFKNSFGAVAAYKEGRIFATYGKFGLALKLPEASRTVLLKEKGGKPLQYFPNGHIKKAYVVLPPSLAGDPGALRELLRESLEFVMPESR